MPVASPMIFLLERTNSKKTISIIKNLIIDGHCGPEMVIQKTAKTFSRTKIVYSRTLIHL